MPDAHSATSYIQILYYAVAGMAAFAVLVGSASGVVFLLLRVKFDDRYAAKSDDAMTRQEFKEWAEEHRRQEQEWRADHDRLGREVISGLNAATQSLVETLKGTNARLDILDSRLYDVMRKLVEAK